jgi:N-acetyl-anhydromuramyl-L-alanine amidase AmpD
MQLQDLQPRLPHRDRNVAPVLIVLHATAGSTARSSINHLRGVGLSYHYIIARDGRDSARFESHDNTDPIVFRCVDDADHAFHVGSTIPVPNTTGGINKNSIGVSLANIQRTTNPERYPAKQLRALEDVVALIKQANPSVTMLTTHAVIQPWNRADPRGVNGPNIAARHGLTFWTPTAAQIAQHRP